MDWTAVATVLGERVERPLFILDRSGKIRLFNRGMEALLGWTRFEVEGLPWGRLCVAPSERSEAKRWIAEGLRGTLRTYDAVTLTKAGGQVMLRLELSLVGRGPTQGVLVSVTESRPLSSCSNAGPGRELEYDVSCDRLTFGMVSRLAVNGELITSADAQRTCFRALYELDRPCTDCPVLRSDGDWPRRLVRVRRTGEAGGSMLFEVTTATQATSSLVRIRTRTVLESEVALIHEAKVRQVAERAKLSAREHEVFTHLLEGRSIEEIATLVGIAVRTVKHHQSSLLQKIGADSRADLWRVIF